MGDVYADAVVETFRKKAIRTAHIIDDMFPTYADLAKPEAERASFGEAALALELYAMFRSKQIPCDIENSTALISEDIDRIRKSDLIVLDYNLAPDDTRTSISLVRQLSRTKHFNTIVVYTAAADLDDVWLDLGIGLRGGWSEHSGAVTREGTAALADLVDGSVELGTPSRELIAACVLGKNPALGGAPDLDAFREIFKGQGIASEMHGDVLSAIAHAEVRNRLADDHESRDAPANVVDGGCDPGKPRWLLSGNCFVTIMGKPGGAPGGVTAASLFDALDAALCQWRPNLLQIIISEIQNILELDALATDELTLRDPNTQVSLCYFLLSAMEDGDEGRTREALAGPLHTLLDKLVDNVRLRLVTDADLRKLGGDLLFWEIQKEAIPEKFKDRGVKRQTLFQHAKSMTRANGDTDNITALMQLNAFLSTEPFRGELTTGTIFKSGNDHWMSMTPACDLVIRPPAEPPTWSGGLHPTKPMIASRLVPLPDLKKALAKAENIRNVFLKIGEAFRAFEAVDEHNGPDYEFFFLTASGRISHEHGVASFGASRIVKGEGGKRDLVPATFEIVGQLRPNYASRYLQQTGHRLSRIGVDFLRHV